MNKIANFFKNNWYYILGVVLLVIIVVVIIRRRRDNNGSGALEPETPVKEQDATFPLQPYSLANAYSPERGSAGKQVAKLQQIYNENISTGTPLVVDGLYGPNSLAAFKGFFDNEIATNGIVQKAQYEQILTKHAQA